MIDKSNLNRVKKVLSAGNGAVLPKYIVQPGDTLSLIITNYNKTNNTSFTWLEVANWNNIQDPNKIQVGQTLSFDNPQKSTLVIPGANPTEGNPNAAVENNALVLLQANSVNTQNLALQISGKPATKLSTILSKNNPTELDLPKTIEVTPEQQKSLDAIKSAGMNLEKEKLEAKLQKKAAIGSAVGLASVAAMNVLDSTIGALLATTDSNTTKTVDTVYDGIAGAVENMGPIGKVVGTAMKFAGVAGDAIQALGGGTDLQTKTDQWMDSSFFSWNIGAINGFLGKNTDSFSVDRDTVESVGSSYGGTVGDLNDAAAKAGKKYGLFSSKARKKANAAIADAKAKLNLMSDISDTATDQRLAVSSMGEQAGLAYSMMTGGGYDLKYTYAAKHGGLLEWNPVDTLEWEPQVELNWELPEFKEGGSIDLIEELEWVPELKNGGKTLESDVPKTEETTQKNVIPEGALHKNKHHMEHAEGLTKKGIPVIDDDGEQQAEIEHSEIIFTLEVTKKLEKYYDIFYSEESSNKEKEQAALEAGKLLVYQILENTDDRTGLIESCKKGGTLTLKKSTDDLIEEVLDWMPTLMVVEEVIEEVKEEEKPKNKSEKELMKEAIKEVLIELLTK